MPTLPPSHPPIHPSSLSHTSQEDAARAYDLAALACKGPEAQINFSPAEYADQLREIEGYTRVSGSLCKGASDPAQGSGVCTAAWLGSCGRLGGRRGVSGLVLCTAAKGSGGCSTAWPSLPDREARPR